jgi:uncharacterized membrane protein
LLIFAATITALCVFVGWGMSSFFHPFHRASDSGREAALAIEKKRYASGEIAKAEFEDLKKDLTG